MEGVTATVSETKNPCGTFLQGVELFKGDTKEKIQENNNDILKKIKENHLPPNHWWSIDVVDEMYPFRISHTVHQLDGKKISIRANGINVFRTIPLLFKGLFGKRDLAFIEEPNKEAIQYYLTGEQLEGHSISQQEANKNMEVLFKRMCTLVIHIDNKKEIIYMEILNQNNTTVYKTYHIGYSLFNRLAPNKTSMLNLSKDALEVLNKLIPIVNTTIENENFYKELNKVMQQTPRINQLKQVYQIKYLESKADCIRNWQHLAQFLKCDLPNQSDSQETLQKKAANTLRKLEEVLNHLRKHHEEEQKNIVEKLKMGIEKFKELQNVL